MNAKQFVIEVEAYYGKYDRPSVKAAVLGYAEGIGDLQGLYDRLVLEFSGEYRYVPDVAVIQRVARVRRTEDVDGVFRHGRRIGHMDGERFIPDLSLLSAEGMRRYVDDYQNYGYPEGYVLLLEKEERALVSSEGKDK